MEVMRTEYPRPQFVRDEWENLNGVWEFAFDDADVGIRERWYRGKRLDRTIQVPFCYQSELSGIGDSAYHPVIWYARTVNLTKPAAGQSLLLHMGAVDYQAEVWLNGVFLCEHQGGYVPFTVDISEAAVQGENRLCLRVTDTDDCSQPRGKQYWKEELNECWYTPTSGIWQTVWLERVCRFHIDKLRMTPDIDRQMAVFECNMSEEPLGGELEIRICYQGDEVCRQRHLLKERNSRLLVYLREVDFVDELHYWSPEHPNLFDVELKLYRDGVETDCVKSYFGMRKIQVRGDRILLNNKPYYQKMVLDQGYWPDGLMTAPDDESFRTDISLAKQMGFNGIRKHNKIEDPRFYYHADKMGMLVWGEMPSCYTFCSDAVRKMAIEWMDFIERDYNHPSIVTWVPFNESWGVRNIYVDQRQQAYLRGIYGLTKGLDYTRLVNTNDGWEQVNPTDICGIHDYTLRPGDYEVKYQQMEDVLNYHAQGRMLFAMPEAYQGQPVMLTEFGGITYTDEPGETFGYLEPVVSGEAFFERFAAIVRAVRRDPSICGFCYTQLTDVMQERNGLLNADREAKVDVRRINKVLNGIVER